MKYIVVKIMESYFKSIKSGQKKFEIRFNDRDYQVGDIMRFEIISENNFFDPSEFKIIYVHHGLGMAKNYVVLGIEEII